MPAAERKQESGAICHRYLQPAGLAERRRDLFAGRVTCFDRNFPGYDLITAILDAGGHVVARVGEGVALPLEPGGGWLPDGSRLSWLNAPSGKEEDRLPVRVCHPPAGWDQGFAMTLGPPGRVT